MLAWALLAVSVVVLVVVLVLSTTGRGKLTREHEAVLAREKAKLRSADQALERLEAELERLRQGGAGTGDDGAERERAFAAREARLAARETQLAAREEGLAVRSAELDRREHAVAQAAAHAAVDPADRVATEHVTVHADSEPGDELARTAMLDRTVMLDSDRG